MNKKLNVRLISFILTLVMMVQTLSGLVVFAAGNGNTSANTNGVTQAGNYPTSREPILNSQGVIVKINSVPNTVTTDGVRGREII